MRLYDALIRRYFELVKGEISGSSIAEAGETCDVVRWSAGQKCYLYDPSIVWPENDGHEMVLQREMAYELGGSGKPAVNITCMTSDEALFAQLGDEAWATVIAGVNQGKVTGTDAGGMCNRVTVLGPDLQEINADAPYARISILLTEKLEAADKSAENTKKLQELSGLQATAEKASAETATDRIYQILQDIDFVKYHVFPKGYMIRISGQSGREQVRVSRKALSEGVSFARIGSTFIKHYLDTEKVRYAHVIFLTLPDLDYKSLEKIGFQASDIKNSLSKIKSGLPTECSICDIKDICSEVEGLRELHFGTRDRQKRGIQL